jgi:ribosomal protein S18 acetylase RimI-like enzyme
MPPAEILVRPAQAVDAADLIAVLLETFESTWLPNITASAADDFRREARAATYVGASGLEFWVAEEAGRVVGLVHWQDDFVHALHVRPSHARRGIGRRLMDQAEAQIANSGFPDARLETDTFNLASQAFYGARGYREAGRYPDEQWNSGLTTILFVKSLG